MALPADLGRLTGRQLWLALKLSCDKDTKYYSKTDASRCFREYRRRGVDIPNGLYQKARRLFGIQ